jgi:hypothetical protein
MEKDKLQVKIEETRVQFYVSLNDDGTYCLHFQ